MMKSKARPHSTTELFQALQRLGAGEFAHLNGTLAEHLHGTAALLSEWGADAILCRAGLFHAAYGTAGFAQAMAPLSLRPHIAELLGADAERLVYLYCCCDRQVFYPRIGTDKQHRLPDRFTGGELDLDARSLRALCELTAANESQIGAVSQNFRHQYGLALLELFRRMDDLLSTPARHTVEKVFGAGAVEQAGREAGSGRSRH